MANKSKKEIDINETTFTAVIYGDGSAINTEGSYGAGATGYIFDNNSIGEKTGDVPSKYTITDIGYLENELLLKYRYNTVVPYMYIDGVFGYNDKGTNNKAELLAFIESVTGVLNSELNITKIVFKSDSSYTLLVIEKIYLGNDWKKDLKENMDLLLKIEDICNMLKSNNILLETIKVKGHGTSLGNNIADRLANLARITKRNEFKLVADNKRWSKKDLLPQLLRFKQLFFINNSSMVKDNIYSIMDYKTGVEPGKKTHEATFGIVLTKEPVELVHEVTNVYNSYYRSLSILSAVDLTNLYSINNIYYYNLFGKDIYNVNPKNNILVGLENDPIVKSIYPPGLAIQAYERMKGMYDVLTRAINNEKNKNEEFIDITRDIYDVDSKPKQYICTIGNGVNDLDVKVNAFDTELTIPLSLGKDALSRNQFKAIEKEKPTILLHLNKIDKVVEYQIIVLTEEYKGIYSNIYSCKIFLDK